MTFALCLQIPNYLHFRRPYEIYTTFIPQFIFLHSIFGYLVVCIIYKWSIDWTTSPTSPPSLLNMLIGMFLSPGSVDPNTQLYAGQGPIQGVLVLIAGLCVPWMLCLKPYLEWKEMQRVKGAGYVGLQQREGARRDSNELEEEEEGVGGHVQVHDEDEEEV